MSAIKFDFGESVTPGSINHPYELKFSSLVCRGDEQSLGNDISAIYCFYSLVEKGSTMVPRLLYIGKSKDLRTRLLRHAKKPVGFPEGKKVVTIEDLKDYLCDPEDVNRQCFYAYSLLDGRSLEKCEAAMIKRFQPSINIQAKNSLGCHAESYFRIRGKYVYSPLESGILYHVAKD